jgi:flagellin-like protein
MKGISPVIATILLLLITVAIVGIAFSFFSRTTSTTTATVEQQMNQQENQMAKLVVIDAYNATSVTIRSLSTGTVTIGTTELNVYVNGTLRSCNPPLAAFVPQTTTAVQTCNFGSAPISCTSTTTLIVAAPGNQDQKTC